VTNLLTTSKEIEVEPQVVDTALLDDARELQPFITPSIVSWLDSAATTLGYRIDEISTRFRPVENSRERWEAFVLRVSGSVTLTAEMLAPWSDVTVETAEEFGELLAEEWPPE
jgi:hypothetical protein